MSTTTLLKVAVLAVCVFGQVTTFGSEDNLDMNYGARFNFGTPASKEDIARVDIDVIPDGRGAPPGRGSYAEGKKVYVDKCAACHGVNLQGVEGTGGAALIGGRDSLASGKPKKTVESYWPYASTLFDYVKRAMPFNAPGSLSNKEVYAVSAYILGEAGVLAPGSTLGPDNIGKVMMPNRNGFTRCDISPCRPDVFNYR